jgi:hypothetical protein
MRVFGPRDTLTFLIGETLSQICIDPWSLQFRFESGTNILAEFQATFVAADGAEARCDIGQGMPALARIHDFLGKAVTDIGVSELQLDLMLEGGAILRLHTETGAYESVVIGSNVDPGVLVF